MNCLRHKVWFRILSGLVLTFLAGEFFAPNKALASCGDYVTFGSGHSGHSNQGQQGEPEPQFPDKSPCQGPLCNGDAPAPVPPTTTPVQVQDWAYLCTAPIQAEAESIPCWAGLENQDRVHRIIPIYHPPRSI